LGRLTVQKIKALKEPGHYVDGDGLALVIGRRGGKSWILRTMVQGRRRDIGLGGLSWVTLAEAREKARTLRKIARDGGDPFTARAGDAPCPSFEEAARIVHRDHVVGTAKNEKHRAQWINTLRDYAFPTIGAKPVRDVDQADMLRVLSPIWTEKPETARRVRQRLRTVIDWARAAGHFEGVNPIEGVEKGLARQRDRVRHHAAMPWEAVPSFLRLLDDGRVATFALRFLILTAARTGEVIGARWSEIDRGQRLWNVPEGRMKARRAHRVPLTDDAVAVLDGMRGLDADFIFPGQKRGRPLSNMAMVQVLRRVGRHDVTVHGFRSSFRDWAEEKGGLPREVAELCLAHEVGNAVERAYRRSDLLDKRRTLMERWARFCCPASADIVEIGKRV